ncbi:MAG: hypothetical protein ABR568_00735 [Pyrinomonadaceae bacterium]
MPSDMEEFQQRHQHLERQINGPMKAELEAVKAKLSAVTADTPTEDVRNLMQEESALMFKIANGEAELKTVENQIAVLYQLQANRAQLVQYDDHHERERIRKGQRIAEIDDLLSGRKLSPPVPREPGQRGS